MIMNLRTVRSLATRFLATMALLAAVLALAPAQPSQAAGARVRVNCGIVTCSIYYSKSATAAMNRSIDYLGFDPAKAIAGLCGFADRAAEACKELALAHAGSSGIANIRAAVKRGGCLVARVNPYSAITGFGFYGNVPLSNPYCEP
ncbi:hypothetical protein [Thermoactinospora rubra]|uniref:hypothetical protein n=1 Tax=Thermoactinospora rubra TaxID=1088767 RepID=UPI000A0F573E|nr:hypothetical protein [Thermoactinospora rubra]